MPKVSDEVKEQIRQSLLAKFQQQYGVHYMDSLHKNLMPSPIAEIAQRYDVPKNCVIKIRSQLMMLGLMFRRLE